MGCVCFITTCACFVKKRDLLVSDNRTVWSYAFWFPEGDLLVLVYLVVQIWRLDVSCHKVVNTITVIESISSPSTLLFLLFRCSGRTRVQWLQYQYGRLLSFVGVIFILWFCIKHLALLVFSYSIWELIDPRVAGPFNSIMGTGLILATFPRRLN